MNKPTPKRNRAEQIEYNIAQVVATQAMEGLIVTEEEKQELRDAYNNKVSFDDIRQKIIIEHFIPQQQ